jgi:hypothetical protein
LVPVLNREFFFLRSVAIRMYIKYSKPLIHLTFLCLSLTLHSRNHYGSHGLVDICVTYTFSPKTGSVMLYVRECFENRYCARPVSMTPHNPSSNGVRGEPPSVLHGANAPIID